jgi:hypothetical protein
MARPAKGSPEVEIKNHTNEPSMLMKQRQISDLTQYIDEGQGFRLSERNRIRQLSFMIHCRFSMTICGAGFIDHHS